MIRIEGIPIVAARLAAAQKPKKVRARKRARIAVSMAASGGLLVGIARRTMKAVRS